MGIETTEKKGDHIPKGSDSPMFGAPPPSPAPNASRWRKFIFRGSTILTVVSGLVSAVVAIWVVFSSYERLATEREVKDVTNQFTISAEDTQYAAARIAEVNSRVSSLQKTLDALTEHLKSISNVPAESALNLQLQQMQTSVSDLSSRLGKLESVILENPVKALEIPVMKREIDDFKASEKAQLKSVKDSVDRVYDLSKWLLGGIAVSIFSLAVGTLLKSKEAPSPSFTD
jgi:hypothetical protein